MNRVRATFEEMCKADPEWTWDLTVIKATGDYKNDCTYAAFRAWQAARGSRLQGTREPGVPEGWQLVPKEPTPEMLRGIGGSSYAPDVWKFALAAAPQPGEQS